MITFFSSSTESSLIIFCVSNLDLVVVPVEVFEDSK